MPKRDAFEAALAALNRKERTAHELALWLKRRDFDLEEIESALRRLFEAGALDDERFARLFAEDKRELSGWGAERIREALLERGVERSTIDAVLAADSYDDQLDRARGILIRRGRPLDGNADRQRALEYLARRGYDYEIAYEAVRSLSARAA
ncbi:MAG: regulatory protein RecX [Solirubrobacterales bacterium]